MHIVKKNRSFISH